MPLAPLKPLRRWIWRAFLQSALIPLVLVESVLIGVYLYTNESIRESQVGYLQSSALQDLDSAVRREGKVIDSRLRAIEAQVGVYRDAVAEALADRRFEPDELERQRHASTPGGVFHSRSDDGRAASFYAASTPAERQDRDKALRLSRVDPLMRSIKQADPLVAAVYFNSWDSYNRIYPYFDVLQQYPHDMDIPQYNFYYLADATHNPKRGTVWTEVYLDPAGLGWMMSAIAPVYRGDFLEGVVGLDVTVGQMLAETGNLQVPWQGYALLVGPDNAIMALPAAGEKDFGLRELTSYSYAEAVSREVLKPGQAGNLFRVYEDKPIYYDNWDIDIFYTEKFWDVTDLQDFTWTENGPVRATLHIERNYSNSTLVQDIHFYAKQRRIEFVTTVDWHEHQSLLKVHFPVNVHTDEATFEIQYGNLTRKTHANTSWDRARFESCGQKWMDLSEGHYGVSMLNDCKYGHSVKDSVIGLTLIKSGIEPNPTTDQEVHHFTYAIYPHAEKWQAAGTVPQAFFLNQPALAVQGGKPGESFSLAGLDAPNVVLETIKRAEDGDGAIVRMYECENSLTNVTLDWNLPFHAAESCNCLEQPDGEPVEVKDGKITFTVKPYEIKTIRIR